MFSGRLPASAKAFCHPQSRHFSISKKKGLCHLFIYLSSVDKHLISSGKTICVDQDQVFPLALFMEQMHLTQGYKFQ